jgi:hypothetical protein
VTSNYSIVLTDALGCTFRDTVTVYVEPALLAPVVSCGPTTSTQITFNWTNVSGAISYEVSLDSGLTWIAPNGTLSHTVGGLATNTSVTLFVRAVGTSTLCPSQIGSIRCTTLNCPLTSQILSQTAVSCNGGSNGSVTVQVNNSIGTLSYQQTSPTVGTAQSNGTFSGLSAGVYSFQISDATLACSITQNVTITQPSAVSVSTSTTNVLCNSGTSGTATATVSGGTSPYNYLWSVSQTNATVTGLTAGTFNVTVTDLNSCSVTSTVTITQPSSITVSTSSSPTLCFGASNGTANASATGGTSPYNFVWSNNSTGQNITGLSASTYTVTVTDANGCQSNQNVTVTQPLIGISLSMSSTNALCYQGNSGTATVLPAGGTAPYQYLWENGQVSSTSTT